MDRKELIEALRYYGDHKGGCGISKILRNPRPPTDSDGHRIYPPCNCGWQDVIDRLRADGEA